MARNLKAPLAGCVACFGGLGLLALLAYRVDAVQRLDASLLFKLASAPGSSTYSLALEINRLGDPLELLLMLAIACGIALVRGRPRSALAALAVVAGANLSTQMLKTLLSHPHFRSIFGAEHLAWAGFPSGHTTAAASIAIAFAFAVSARLRPLALVLGGCLAAAVGSSVLILSWHYPSDVLGGVLVAAGWGFAVLAALRALAAARPRRAAQLGSRAAISLK